MKKYLKKGLEPVIHAGFQKCASTFLQKQIFPCLKNRQMKDNSLYADLGKLYLEDIRHDSPIFRLPFEDGYLLSNDSFMAYDLPLAWRKYGDAMRKDIFISNITHLFKDRGKLLFIIRRQDSIMESWLKWGHFQKGEYFFVDYPVTGSVLDEYREPHKGKYYGYDVKIYQKAHLVNKYGTTYTHFFDYFDIFKRIAVKIDKSRICILLFEDLENDQRKFYRELGDFIDEDLSIFVNADLKKERVSENLPMIRHPRLSELLADFDS
jgi:hypothetical protein